ncbi:unnamed protein product [Gordionus sp. m RMFG-2023]
MLEIKGSIYISTYNINGLNNKISILTKLLSNEDIDIIALQETHLRNDMKAVFRDFSMLNSGTIINKWSGTAFLVKNSIYKFVRKFVPISEMMAALYLNTAFKPTILLNIYAPPTLKERKPFFDELENVIDTLPKRYNLIVMGDFNTKIGKDEYYLKNNVIMLRWSAEMDRIVSLYLKYVKIKI